MEEKMQDTKCAKLIVILYNLRFSLRISLERVNVIKNWKDM